MMINKFTSPFAASTWWQQLIAHKLFMWFAFQFMYSNINSSTTTIKNHDNRSFYHLIFDWLLEYLFKKCMISILQVFVQTTIKLIMNFLISLVHGLLIYLIDCFILLFFLFLCFWFNCWWLNGSCSRCFELEFTVSYFCTLFICGCSTDLGATKY